MTIALLLALNWMLGSPAAFAGPLPVADTVLRASCYSCHGQDGRDSGGLGSILDGASLARKGFVSPGDPDSSQLIRSVESGQMPLGAPHLGADEITSLKSWIKLLPPLSDGGPTPPSPTPLVCRPSVPLPSGGLPSVLDTFNSAASVLEHHGNPTRNGVYADPSFARSALAGLKLNAAFSALATLDGPVYAQPLYVENGYSAGDLVIVASETNQVYAFDATTGALVWKRKLADPVALGDLPCGNIDPLGVTGTPAVDPVTKAVYFDAMTSPDGGKTKQHLVYSLSIRDGTVRGGWPVDVSARLQAVQQEFHSEFQNQRGAITVLGNQVYIPYGGHYGDCGDYHGWVIGLPTTRPSTIKFWKTGSSEGGIWSPGGFSSDGHDLFLATGNTDGATEWSGGEAIIRLHPDLKFSGKPEDYFTPSNWKALDDIDADLGGVSPILADLPGANPSKLVLAFGKDGFIYVLERARLGGIGGCVSAQKVSTRIIGAPAVFQMSDSLYVVFKGKALSCPQGTPGDLEGVKITAGTPPTLEMAWCSNQNGMGSPIVTTTDGHSQPILWSVGAEGDQKLHAFDLRTGVALYTSHEKITGISRYETPIVSKGRIYLVGAKRLYQFSLK